jgi:hypothetical protein
MSRLSPWFALLMVPIAFCQQDVRVTEVGKERFEAHFPSDGELRMKVRSGEVAIFGGDDSKVLVRYEGRNAGNIKNVRVSLSTSGNRGVLEIQGGPKNELRILIQVPRKTGIHVRVPAGDLKIEGITGSKDVELTAGDLKINTGDPKDYGPVDASVHAGGLSAGPFAVQKGGLFRSFTYQGGGPYKLHAHVTAGDLTLK